MMMGNGARWLRLCAATAVALAGRADRASAQRQLYEFAADTAFPAGDTARIEAREVPGMSECFVSNTVVRDSASLAELRRFPQCRGVDVPPLAERTLVGVNVFADCAASYRVDAFRSAARREYRVRLSTQSGGCRGGLARMHWFALPALPAGWTVRFTWRRVPSDDVEFTRGARHLGGSYPGA